MGKSPCKLRRVEHSAHRRLKPRVVPIRCILAARSDAMFDVCCPIQPQNGDGLSLRIDDPVFGDAGLGIFVAFGHPVALRVIG